MTRIPISFSGATKVLSVMGISPEKSWIELDDVVLRVRMGWSFRLEAPRGSVQGARLDDRPVRGIGVESRSRGSWLVNGSRTGIVSITIEPRARGRAGPVPVKVREVRVSVDDPDALIAALGFGSTTF